MTTTEEVASSLKGIVDSRSAVKGVPMSVVDMGMVRRVAIDGGGVRVELRLTTPLFYQVPYFHTEIERLVGALDGVKSVTCDHDPGIEREPGLTSPDVAGLVRPQDFAR